MNRLVSTCAIVAGTLIGSAVAQEAPPPLPAGEYKLDKSHASLIFRVNHLGFSNYTGKFKTFDATMIFDPANAATSKLTATVDANSLDVDGPPEGFLDELKGEKFLNAGKCPEMTFVSTAIEVTGDKTGKITGDFTLNCTTKPVVLDVTFNGGWPGLPEMDPNARAGFSAQGVLKRSEFGISYGLPSPETGGFGVGDDVEVHIEAEFVGPALAQ